MATPQTHPLIFFMNFKLSSALFFMLIISLSLMNYCNALGGRKILQKEYVTFDVNSFLSTSCKASVQGGNNRGAIASLKVTHRHGPCSKSGLNDSNNNRPSLADVLARDQIRVASIQNNRHGFNKSALGDSKATITAKPDTNVGFSNYVVSVGLGTPTKYLTLVFDTGSSLTWTQCQPCTGHCYPQKDSIFDPSASTSYTNSSCDSTECSQLSNTGLQQQCSPESTCLYHTGYGDGSFTNGNLGNELLTLTPNDVFDDFTFGCGEDNDGLFGDTAGILGLGRDSFSVVSQTAEKYGNYFSYCLPTESGSDGHLTFGNDNGASVINLAFTPFADNSPQGSSFYFVNIVSISVGGTQLTISPSVFQSGGGFIIDSGTIITRLPPTAYAALRDAFKQQMSAYTSAPGDSFLDTCYDFSNDSSPQEIPSISFTFDGNVKVDLGSEEVLINKDQSIFCLAFAANNEDTDIGIFGNLQQQTFEVAYDVAGGRLGFGPNGCS